MLRRAVEQATLEATSERNFIGDGCENVQPSFEHAAVAVGWSGGGEAGRLHCATTRQTESESVRAHDSHAPLLQRVLVALWHDNVAASSMGETIANALGQSR